MDIDIKGQSLDRFIVTITDDTRTEEFNIPQLLNIEDDNINARVQAIAAQEHFWHQLALEAELAADTFEKSSYATFLAHHDKFARWYMKGIGDKNFTNTAKESVVINLFSASGHGTNRDEYIATAYVGYESECEKIAIPKMTKEQFSEEMYTYEPTWEDGIERLLSLRHRAAQLKTIANAFGNLAWNLKSLAADKRALVRNDLFQ